MIRQGCVPAFCTIHVTIAMTAKTKADQKTGPARFLKQRPGDGRDNQHKGDNNLYGSHLCRFKQFLAENKMNSHVYRSMRPAAVVMCSYIFSAAPMTG